MMDFRALAVVCALAVMTVACRADPEVARQRLVDSGDRYAAAGQYDEAVIEYTRALQVDPAFGLAYERLGEVYLETGDRTNAWQSYQRAADLSPDDIDLQIRAGGVLLVTQRFDDARRIAERVLEMHPEHVEALVLRANSLVGLENIDTAIAQMEDAIQMAPNESELYSNLGSLQATSGQIAEAEETFKQAVAAGPDSVSSYLPLGNFYWATGRPGNAEAAFLKAVELEPGNLLAHRALATFYLGTGLPLQAEASLKFVAEHSDAVEHRVALADFYLVTGRRPEGVALLEALTDDPDVGAAAQTRLAALAYAEGRRDEARQTTDEILERFPRSASTLLLKARFALEEGQHDEALRLATSASNLEDGYLQALYLVGQLHTQDGDYFQAAEAYKRVLRANPRATQAQVQLSRLLLAEGETDDARMLLNMAIRTVRPDDSARLSIVGALLERRDLVAAEQRLNDLIREYPETPAVHTLMGALHFLKRDYTQSRRWYDRALEGAPASIDALSGLVGLDLVAGRQADALARIDRRLAEFPNSTPVLLLLARTYGATRNLAKAEETLRLAIETNPDSFEAYGMLGQLLYEQGRLADGRREFENLVELRPRAVAALTMVAVILRREGRTDEAVEQYKRVLAIDPQAAVAANNLAWIYAEQGRNLDEAVMLGRAAKKKLPDVVEVSDTLGWVYYRTGQPDSLKLALPHLQESVEKAPTNPLFRYHYGAALARAGRLADARAQLEQALELSQDFHGSAETRRILAGLP